MVVLSVFPFVKLNKLSIFKGFAGYKYCKLKQYIKECCWDRYGYLDAMRTPSENTGHKLTKK